MAVKYEYLVDPLLGFQTKSGSLNVAGILRVFDAATDDPAVTYCDFSGTENSQDIRLDDNGRAVVIADDSRAYRIDVCDRYGALLYNQTPMYAKGGGGGVLSNITVTSHDGTVDVTTTSEGGVKNFDLSVKHDDPEFIVTDSCAVTGTQNHSGYIVPQNRVDGGMDITSEGILLLAGNHYHVDAWINVNADQDNSDPSNEYRNREMLLNFRLGSENGTPVSMTFDNSYSHTSTYNLSGDIHPSADTYLKIYFDNYEWSDYQTGSMSPSHFDLPKLSVHSIVGHYYGEGGGSGEYIAGDGITITESTISVDFDDVQHKLTAGTGITIQNNVISSTGGSGTTYTAGSGININSSNQISVDETTIQHKLTAGSGVTIQNNVISATGGGSGLPGYVFTIPEYTYSGSAVSGWSWTDFRATIDANVADSVPMMVVRQSHGNHPAGETAFYYHAIQDSTIASGWIYVFGTVTADTSVGIDEPRNTLETSQHVTYQFYEGSDDSVIVRILNSNLVQCPSAEYTTSGDALTIYHNYSTSRSSFVWKNLHEFVDIKIDYKYDDDIYPPAYVMLQDVSTIWNTAYNAVVQDRTPRIRLGISDNRHYLSSWLSKRQNLICSYTDIDVEYSPNSGTIQFTGTFFNSNGGYEETWICVLNRASSNSTPTITWKKQTREAHTWDPSNP